MASTVAAQQQTATNGSKATSSTGSNNEYLNSNGTLPSMQPPTPPAAPAGAAGSKKSKSKKAVDPNETGKLLAAKVKQLELDAAGEKDQELEIGGYMKTIAHLGVLLCRFSKSENAAFLSASSHGPGDHFPVSMMDENVIRGIEG
jgi:hypothetical protein